MEITLTRVMEISTKKYVVFLKTIIFSDPQI
jgi:hypothetical protein